jgi:hypothetical protein
MSTPGNLLLYDVSGDKPRWSGAASLTTSIVEGYANRVAVEGCDGIRGRVAQGDSGGDRRWRKTAFDASNPSLVMRQMSKPGGGFAREAVKTIAVSDPAQPYTAELVDLEVADVAWLGEAERLVFATGNSKALGLVVADPNRLAVVSQRPDGQPGGMVVEKGTSSIEWARRWRSGSGVAAPCARRRDGEAERPGGDGARGDLDLSPMANRPPPGVPTPKPEVVAFVAVPGIPGDILIYGTTAIVSSWTGTASEEGAGLASLIDLTDPANARVIGTLTGVGSRLALGPGNILFSTDRTFLKGTPTELDGVQSAALGSVAVVKKVQPDRCRERGRSDHRAIKVSYRLIAPPEDLDGLAIELVRDQKQVTEAAVALPVQGTFELTLPAGVPLIPHPSPGGPTPAGRRHQEPAALRQHQTRAAAKAADAATYHLQAPQFTGSIPAAVQRGTPGVNLTIEGRNLGGLSMCSSPRRQGRGRS